MIKTPCMVAMPSGRRARLPGTGIVSRTEHPICIREILVVPEPVVQPNAPSLRQGGDVQFDQDFRERHRRRGEEVVEGLPLTAFNVLATSEPGQRMVPQGAWSLSQVAE